MQEGLWTFPSQLVPLMKHTKSRTTHVHAHTYTHAHTHTYTHAHTHSPPHARIYTRVHTLQHMHTHPHMPAYTRAHITHTQCTHNAHIHAHVRAHTHTLSWPFWQTSAVSWGKQVPWGWEGLAREDVGYGWESISAVRKFPPLSCSEVRNRDCSFPLIDVLRSVRRLFEGNKERLGRNVKGGRKGRKGGSEGSPACKTPGIMPCSKGPDPRVSGP